MKWWIRLVRRHEVFRDLGLVTVFNLLVLSLWMLPLHYRLLALWISATVSYFSSCWLLTRIMRGLKSVDAIPNSGTLGMWLVAFLGLTFNATILIGSYVEPQEQQPITAFTIAFVLAYSYKAWTFFSVAKRAVKELK